MNVIIAREKFSAHLI